MSVYTTQVRWIVESGGTLALSQYPIFEEGYRTTLNKKIQDHFYFREIGFETVGLFNNRLAARMNEIMPYYNELYKSALLITNPLINKLYKESFSRHNTGTDQRSRSEGGTDTDKVKGLSSSTGSGTKGSNESRTESENEQTQQDHSQESSQDGQSIASDTPQGLLSTEDVFQDSTWASQASAQKGSSSGSSTGSGSRDLTGSTQLQTTENTSQEASTSTSEDRSHKHDLFSSGTDTADHWETFERSLSGLEGTSQAALVMEFRQTLLNIDMMIIESLEDLFMQIW